MNINEAKTVLLLYRPGTADAEDPQIAEALALAKHDSELAGWLEKHCAAQQALREKFRQILAPAGLKEQIISEHSASKRTLQRAPRKTLAIASAFILLAGVAAIFWPSPRSNDDTMDVFQNQMAGIALRGYGMDLTTNDMAQIRHYLALHQAPADYVLPAALQKAGVVGCAVEGWQNGQVSMICFRTGRPLPPNQSSDLWLFVVPRGTLRNFPLNERPRLTVVKNLITAVWAQGDKVYLLGTAGNESVLRQFL